MNKKIIVLLTIISLLLMSCEAGNNDGTGDVGKPFVGGTTGLLISFVENAPPAEVYDGGDFPFDIEIKLQNDGERQINKQDVTVTISGIDPVEFGKTASFLTKSPDDDLLAKTKDAQGSVLESNPVYVTFSDLNHGTPIIGSLTYPLFANICYKYGTDVVSRLCIKDDLYETGGACNVAEDKQVDNSAAPIQVTKFTESVAGTGKIAFTFQIEHKGNGNIFKLGTKCNEAQERANINKVFVDVSTGLANLQCTGLSEGTASSGYVTMRDSGALIRCTQPITSATTFVKPVNIKLEYDYEENINKQIIVLHSGE